MIAAEPRVAILIPCLNEAITIGKVIADFREQLPSAAIYVIDNGSDDGTGAIAAAHGARVLVERRRGKGEAIRRAFRSIDADIYVMVDGDDTYPSEAVQTLLAPVVAGEADMVVGSRIMEGAESTFRLLNQFGNHLFLWVLALLLGVRLTDILSGYRAMSRDFVKQIPLASRAFEIETELTIKAIERGYRLVEVPAALRDRPAGSVSKIRHFQDGSRILGTMLLLFRDYRPMQFFGYLGLMAIALALAFGFVVVREFLLTGRILHIPSAILSVGLVLAGMLSLSVGLVLSAVGRRFQEIDYKLDMLTASPMAPESDLHVTGQPAEAPVLPTTGNGAAGLVKHGG